MRFFPFPIPPTWHRAARRAATFGVLLLAATAATAHDSWFQVQSGPDADDEAAWTLALGTGDRFPVMEFPLAAEYLPRHGCRSPQGPAQALRDSGLSTTSQRLRTPAGAGRPLSCWAQSQPFEVTLRAALVPVYLKEIQAGPELRATWAAMQSRGVTWRERYSKHARIELPGPDGALAPPQPAGLPLEAVMDSGGRGPQRGQSLTFTLLRDGRPLAGLPLEWVHERSRIGLWRRTDAQGRVDIALPWSGRWLLRGTDLRLSETQPDTWESRFVTLAFEVGEPRP